jgi:hypothetical protein
MSKTLIFKPSKLLIWPFVLVFAFFGALAIHTAINYPLPHLTGMSSAAIAILSFLGISISLRRLKQEYYTISDYSIQVQTHRDDSTISLINIDGVTGVPYKLLRFRKMGKIVITANGQHYVLRGMEEASSRATLIWQAAQVAKAQHDERNRPNYYQPPTHAAGTLEIMNDLVGLWQQGMLTDEEYNKEVKRMTADLTESK